MTRKTRNLAARSPLMRKGGVHEISQSTRRTAARVDLDDAYEEWLEERRLASPPSGHSDQKGGPHLDTGLGALVSRPTRA